MVEPNGNPKPMPYLVIQLTAPGRVEVKGNALGDNVLCHGLLGMAAQAIITHEIKAQQAPPVVLAPPGMQVPRN